ncbi:aminotransferase class I/II-fold pyridoxal phosphate-dependent enzyme [uncultured Sphingomonas sp.]|uniref:aminotransferase class I/II-fold pyridoxal phosphate-dependent enzyme n=1 Tax=uncultured Sphingomonas sp. TaxID=158754 RepID=UPI0035CA5219
MDQTQAPLVAALTKAEAHPTTGFGAPGHSAGAAIPRGLRALVGAKAFKADLLTVKGVEDRTESDHALNRAHELAAAAWGADMCRFITGGSTQILHTALAAVARAGETVLLPTNSHKAEWSYALVAGLDAVPLQADVDPVWDVETVVTPVTLAAALAAHPHAKAAVVVSPNYYGMTCDIERLAQVAHAHGIPLIVDAAWGAAFAFSPRLPTDALALGADIEVCSVHKTMGALAQGSVLLAKGNVVDQQRLALAYELFETTSPSFPILGSLDATRRDHALGGAKLWDDALDLAEQARTEIVAIPGLVIYGQDRVEPRTELDRAKILIDLSALSIAGYAADDWLYEHHHLHVGLSNARHLLVVITPGTAAGDVRKLVKALTDLSDKLRADPSILPAAPVLPGLATLVFERAMPGPDAFFAEVEEVPYEACAGRIAAEIVAPSPPGVPRLVPGQRITREHVAWLVANRDAGMFILDPADPAEHRLRVVAANAPAVDRPAMFAAEA